MTPDERERMSSLCQRITTEKDRTVFLELVKELNDVLTQKETRLTEADGKRGAPAARLTPEDAENIRRGR